MSVLGVQHVQATVVECHYFLRNLDCHLSRRTLPSYDWYSKQKHANNLYMAMLRISGKINIPYLNTCIHTHSLSGKCRGILHFMQSGTCNLYSARIVKQTQATGTEQLDSKSRLDEIGFS